MNKLPPIIRDPIFIKINDQMEFVLFPKQNGQPGIDIIRMNLTQIKGKKTSVFMTPCEAMEIIAGLSSAVQFYLYNQKQYREEVLEPRLKIAKERSKSCKVCKGKKSMPDLDHNGHRRFWNNNKGTKQCPAYKGSGV